MLCDAKFEGSDDVQRAQKATKKRNRELLNARVISWVWQCVGAIDSFSCQFDRRCGGTCFYGGKCK